MRTPTTRTEAERLINDVLYPLTEETGMNMLLELLEERGTSILTDEALITIAKRQHDLEASKA